MQVLVQLILASVGIFSPGGLVTLRPCVAFFKKIGMDRFLGATYKVLKAE